jgi:hypothetical protein
VTLTAGARADLEVRVPGDGIAIRVQLSNASAVIIGPAGADAAVPPPQPTAELDLLAYGSPAHSASIRPTPTAGSTIGSVVAPAL